MAQKPRLSFWQIWNMSVGFLGVQFGFALQNANASRILQTFGADVEHLSWFWLAAPLTGMIVQPIIGHYSDRTWTKLGRRRPYFLFGALAASIALAFMPNSAMLSHLLAPMYIGAGMLMIMDASFNVAMEPFRALVADLLPADQTTLGFSIQTFLIGIGAVVGSWLPYVMAEWLGVAKVSETGGVPDNVIFSFYVGAIVLVGAILWTVISTKEYPPEVQATFQEGEEVEEESGGLMQIFKDFAKMPTTMKQLGLVQFFSWIALFSMWVFTTPAVAQHHFGLPVTDTSSEAYNDAGNWVGILFGVYNFVAMIYAIFLPTVAKLTSRKMTHAISLGIGGIGMISMYFIQDPNWLIFSMICIGIAWASILAMPYAILAPSLPAKKMGIYMGIFNFFITFPQIMNGIFGGPMVKRLFDSEAIFAIIFAGVAFLVAAVSVVFVKDRVGD
ncbi:MFS transporter [Flammeovirgaceae bacterium SG7u.111]|nr:MFS transporter [Flammeovirgaceae bacterium SG7u.132]WPO38347.1 MFS transporter [Flammeovirgaceae bacterium SG7u.111]